MAVLIFLVFSALIAPVFGHVSYCERQWPSLDLFMPIRLYSNKNDPRYWDLEALFLRSFLLFWPLKLSNTSLNLAIDAELNSSPESFELKTTIRGVRNLVPGGIKLTLLQPSMYYRKGYDRQQLVMFWADNFTDKEYVGFVDSDCAFITYIDREDLFEDGKPVVNAKSGYHPIDKNGVYKWAAGTYNTLGILEPFRCMSYFPVIVKVSHLKDMREYIAKRHNLSFDEVFYHNISGGVGYSQFGVMCTYLWAFKRDEYKWYVHTVTPLWDGIDPEPLYGQDGNVSQFTPQMLLPKPRIATHVYYRRKPYNPILNIHKRLEMNQFLREGVCNSPPFPRTEAVCNDSRRPTLAEGFYYEMHNFEYVDYALLHNASVLRDQYEQRHNRIKNCNHSWASEELKLIMKPNEEMQSGGWARLRN